MRCGSFIKKYGEIGAVALELANRLKYPFEDKQQLIAWERFTNDCGCAMCKQWHHKWSDERLRKYYKKLYFAQYYGKNMKRKAV